MQKPKRASQSLTKAVSFRLTEADYVAYQAKVEASGLSPSVFFRTCVLQNKTQIIAKVKSSKDKQRLMYLFNKTSNNINQLAYKANSAHLSDELSEKTYEVILSQLHQISTFMKSVINDVD